MAFQAAPMPMQQQQQYSNGMHMAGNTAQMAFGGTGGGMHAQQQQHHAPLHSSAPSSSPPPAASISQLVQALQSGSISKQQLYSSLTDMYKGGQAALAGGSSSNPAASPSPSPSPASSLHSSFSLGLPSAPHTNAFNTPMAHGQQHQSQQPSQHHHHHQQQPQQQIANPQFPSFQQPQQQPSYQSQPFQPQSQQSQSHFQQSGLGQAPSPFSAGYPSASVGAAPANYSASDAAAAQAQIQSFLSKRLGQQQQQQQQQHQQHSGAAGGAAHNQSLDLSLTNSSLSSILQNQPQQQQAPQQSPMQGQQGYVAQPMHHSFNLSASQSQFQPLQSGGMFGTPAPASAHASFGSVADDGSQGQGQGQFVPNLSFQAGQATYQQQPQQQPQQFQQQLQQQYQQQPSQPEQQQQSQQYQQSQFQHPQQQQQQQQQHPYHPQQPHHSHQHSQSQSEYPQDNGYDGADSEAEEYTDGSMRGSIHGGYSHARTNDSFGSTSQRSHSRAGSQSQSQRHRHGGGGGGGGQSSRSSARHSVRERMAAVWTEEKNAELTFKPTITPLPRRLYRSASARQGGGAVAGDDASDNESVGTAATSAAPFLGRVMHWSETKKARERQLSVELEKRALAECTFKPRINDESAAIVEAPGADQRRLFSARSTARAKILELEVRRAEEESFRANCTFEPALNKKSLDMAANMAVRVRPASASAAYGASGSGSGGSGLGPALSSLDAELAQCTFAPKVNAPKADMVAANLYLEQNAFERLSSRPSPRKHRQNAAAAAARRGEESEGEAGYESEGGLRRGRNRSRSGSASARSRSQDARSVSPSMSARGSGSAGAGAAGAGGADKPTPNASFGEFLARLKYKEFQRAERLAALKLAEQAAVQHGRPMLSKKSAQIVRQSMEKGTYASPSKRSTKAAAAAAAAAAGASPAQIASLVDPECTFAPSINSYSSNLSRRSFAEMSALEMARRAQNIEIKQQEILQQQMEQVSFQPFLNKPTGKLGTVDGRLRVLSEPEQYVERLQFQAKLREAEVARQKQLRDEAEVAQCTFAPAVHEAPAFVKRIARSMEITRQQQPATQTRAKGGKPDWK